MHSSTNLPVPHSFDQTWPFAYNQILLSVTYSRCTGSHINHIHVLKHTHINTYSQMHILIHTYSHTHTHTNTLKHTHPHRGCQCEMKQPYTCSSEVNSCLNSLLLHLPLICSSSTATPDLWDNTEQGVMALTQGCVCVCVLREKERERERERAAQV